MTKSRITVDRVSIPYHVPPTVSSYDIGFSYPRMFIQDVAKYLFPVDGEVDRTPIFQLSSDDERTIQAIERAFVYYKRGYAELTSRLSAFGNQTMYGLLEGRTETVEVAPIIGEKGQTDDFLVLGLSGVRRFAGFTWQTIPKNAFVRDHPENGPQPVNRHRIRLPRNRVVHMRLPQEYRRIPSGLRALRQIGNAVPNFGIQNLNPDGTIRAPYDIRELQEIEQRAVASITQSTGWCGIGTFNEAITSYYTMHRFLRFEEFKIRLRKTVVDGINRILTVAGRIIGFKAEVSLHHLPTLEEVAISRNDLAAGRLSFREMMDQYSIYRRSLL